MSDEHSARPNAATVLLYAGAAGIVCDMGERLAGMAMLTLPVGVGVPDSFRLHEHEGDSWFSAKVTRRQGQLVQVRVSPCPAPDQAPDPSAAATVYGRVAFGEPAQVVDCVLTRAGDGSLTLELPAAVEVPDAFAYIAGDGEVFAAKVLERHYPEVRVMIMRTEFRCSIAAAGPAPAARPA